MTFTTKQTQKNCFSACSEDKVKNGLCDCVNIARFIVAQNNVFQYTGWMSQEAQLFFDGHIIREERDGVAVVGTFIKLASGKTHLPSKGDVFTKHENNTITVKSQHRE